MLSPRAGTDFETNSSVDVTARVTDADEIQDVELVWHYNGERYPCPTEGPNVDCRVEGDVYRWSVSLGSAAERPFQVTARNALGRRTTTPRRSIHVHRPGAGQAPVVNQLEPNADTRWSRNSRVRIVARVRDADLSDVRLVWDYNGNEYACPRNGQYVDCSRNGDVYTWLVRVSTGQRTFNIVASDDEGNRTTTPSQTIRLGQ